MILSCIIFDQGLLLRHIASYPKEVGWNLHCSESDILTGQSFIREWLTSGKPIQISLKIGSNVKPNLCGDLSTLKIDTVILCLGEHLIHEVFLYIWLHWFSVERAPLISISVCAQPNPQPFLMVIHFFHLLENPLHTSLAIEAIKIAAVQLGILSIVDHIFDPPFELEVSHIVKLAVCVKKTYQ